MTSTTNQPIQKKQLISATLLVTGCCIGAGMLGLPVKSALAGFLPSSIAMVFCYIFTTFMGLLLLEATLWFEQRVNLPSMAEYAFGKVGRFFAMILFLSLFYCLFVAYLDGGGTIFSSLMSVIFHHPISHTVGMLSCMILVAGITYTGSHFVVRFNRVMLLGLIISYIALVIFGSTQIQTQNLTHYNLYSAIFTVPILLICFGFQNLVPTVTYYLKKNVEAIRIAIIIGNLIPFFIYLIWNMVILGMISEEHLAVVKQANFITSLFQAGMHSSYVIYFINSFTMFAMLISFIPNAMSFVDFLQDGFSTLSHKVKVSNHFLLLCCVFIPPTIFSLFNPGIFLRALSFAGGFIDVLLFGILPACIIIVGRYFKKMKSDYQVMGGMFTPVMMIILCVIILLIRTH